MQLDFVPLKNWAPEDGLKLGSISIGQLGTVIFLPVW